MSHFLHFLSVVVFILYSAEGYLKYHQNFKSSRCFNLPVKPMQRIYKTPNIYKCAVIGIGIFTQLGFAVAAPLEDISDIDVVQTQSKPALSEDERVKRKLELQRKASQTESINTYKDSLSREQTKQDSMKKSKVARSKDLCEVLGRGC